MRVESQVRAYAAGVAHTKAVADDEDEEGRRGFGR